MLMVCMSAWGRGIWRFDVSFVLSRGKENKRKLSGIS
jgi:hypothetical protein